MCLFILIDEFLWDKFVIDIELVVFRFNCIIGYFNYLFDIFDCFGVCVWINLIGVKNDDIEVLNFSCFDYGDVFIVI